jgi:hypothetical protein
VPLESAGRFGAGLALGRTAVDVVVPLAWKASLDLRGGVQDLVDLPVTAVVEPVADLATRGRGDGCGAVERREPCGAGKAGHVIDHGHEGGGTVPFDAEDLGQGGAVTRLRSAWRVPESATKGYANVRSSRGSIT